MARVLHKKFAVLQVVMRHHFVPEIYLKQFSKDCAGHFFRVKRGNKKIKWIHTSGVCYRDDFYNINDPELLNTHSLAENSFLEKYAFPYERGWVNLIENFKTQQYIDRSIHERLLRAYMSLKQRTPFFRKQFADQKLLANVFERVTSEMHEQYKTLIEHSNVDFDSMKADQLAKIRDASRYSEETHLRGLIESVQGVNVAWRDAFVKLLSMNFEVLTPAVENDFFLTSDNPGFSLNGEQIWNTNFGWFDTVAFPISSKHAIYFNQFNSLNHLEVLKRVRYRKITSAEIDTINYATLVVSDELLFCENEVYLKNFLNRFEYPSIQTK